MHWRSSLSLIHRTTCFVSGSNLEATLDTTEEALDAERRVRVKGLRVISDAPTCYGSVGARETIQSTPTYSPEQLINAKGLHRQHLDAHGAGTAAHPGRHCLELCHRA
jgi:hypothetical protein